jgi:sterol desaturase/sphingolipid hydroxylase (fatty acid hydroxylase superfamily)
MHLAFHFDDNYDGYNLTWWCGGGGPGSWFQKMKDAHLRHHYRDNSKEFGVTVDFWDKAMGTKREQDVKLTVN